MYDLDDDDDDDDTISLYAALRSSVELALSSVKFGMVREMLLSTAGRLLTMGVAHQVFGFTSIT